MSVIKIQSEYNDLDKYKFDIKHSTEIVFYTKKDTEIVHNPYGAAVINKYGYKEYWINNKLHRLDGPARIWPNGVEAYYINDKQLSKEEFEYHPERLKFLNKEHLICLK